MAKVTNQSPITNHQSPKKMIENPEDIELRSEEVQEILGTPPAWLIRWGTTIVFFVVIGIIAVSWFVKYPDIIQSQVMITTPNMPTGVVTRSSGYLSKLLVEDGETVEAGQQLVIMESNENMDDVLALEAALKNIQDKSSRVTRLKPDEDWKLGQFQSGLSRLMQIQKEYKLTLSTRFDLRKIEQLERQINQTEELKKELLKRKQTQKKVLDIATLEFERNKEEIKEGLISVKEYNEKQSTYLQKKQSYDDLESQIINFDIQIANIESQIAEIEGNTEVQNSNKIILVEENVNELLSSIDTWKKQYILEAPITGKVSLTIFAEERQLFEAGKEVMTVIPEKTSRMQGIAQLPIAGSGKVEEGQRVNIKLAGFPYQEYGIVQGKVETMSAIPREGNYDIIVSLPDGLNTSYNKELRFQQQMEGVAEIITKERRLIERIFEQLISVFKNQ